MKLLVSLTWDDWDATCYDIYAFSKIFKSESLDPREEPLARFLHLAILHLLTIATVLFHVEIFDVSFPLLSIIIRKALFTATSL